MGFFFNNDKIKKEKKEAKPVDESKVQLKKEELDIAKHKSKIGDVEIGKEIVTEHKVIDVPVTHEEVIIERRALNNEPSDSPIKDEEKIRIPVMDEYVDVAKNTVVVGEVSAKKRVFEEDMHIDETLKKEEARINTNGDSKIVKDNPADQGIQ